MLEKMGCGASKSANARNDSNIDEVEAVTTSVTQIRDMAPAEVADTGDADANRLSSSSRRGESLIKMHPPKKPQRLEDSDILKIKPIEPDVQITNTQN
ncbi:unnamed protein product [Larinioides sclopetarius]|uniref:Uncharacterized protein n=1 Tax=Larinioides sclopetarius TaxID=280406 RepID=A0AAV1ZSM4_9ARAC